jgi:hypothetical protein
VNRRLSAIRLAHIGAELMLPHEAPEVLEAMRRIRRTRRRASAPKAPLLPDARARLVHVAEVATPAGARPGTFGGRLRWRAAPV